MSKHKNNQNMNSSQIFTCFFLPTNYKIQDGPYIYFILQNVSAESVIR